MSNSGPRDPAPHYLPGAPQSPPVDAPPAAAPARPLTVTGQLIQGVECAAMRSDEGTVYSFSRAVEAPLGTRLRVTGTIQHISFCQQGITLEVTSLELLP